MINNMSNYVIKIKIILKKIFCFFCSFPQKKQKPSKYIERMVPSDDYEYFFGYYDKSPWNKDETQLLCLKVKCAYKECDSSDNADIILINAKNKEIKKIATTHCWNIQQGCMLQWLGPDFNDKVIYNDFRNGKYCSVILTISTGKEEVISKPVYSVSNDGKFALSLDFSRLHNLRPGYGYANIPEFTKNISLPDTTAIWKIDLNTGMVENLLKYTDFAKFQPRKENIDKHSIHKINHIMINPNGTRFMVLYRWFYNKKKYTRLITCNVDGTDMYVLSDDDMVSHCYWKNNEEIIAFENKNGYGNGYYLMRDKSKNFVRLFHTLSEDGHPSYSPNLQYIISDTYPSNKRIQHILLMQEPDDVKVIADLYSPLKYFGNYRCDLHPRWSPSGNKISFDATFEGKRKLYTFNVEKYLNECGK